MTTIESQRESQRRGSEGIGLNKNSFIDDLRDNNQAPSINGDGDGDDTTASKSDVTPQAWMP